MTWQDPGGNAAPGSPDDDATRADWGSPVSPVTPPPPAPPDAPPAAPAPWPPTGPVPGSAWAPPPYATGGRYAVPGAPGLEYAGALPRFAAFIVDIILISIAAAIVAIPFVPAVTQVTQTNGFWMSTTNYAVRTGVGSLVAVGAEAVYFTLLWMSSGRATLGMRLFNLQVGRAGDGQRLEPLSALTRWLAFGSWLGLLGFSPALAGLAGLLQLGWSIVLLISTVASPTHQGIHDRIAGSAIVRPAGAGNGLALTCVVLLLILPLIALISIVALIFLGGQVSSILSDVGTSI